MRKGERSVNYRIKQIKTNTNIAAWESFCGERGISPWTCAFESGAWSYARRLGLPDSYFNTVVQKINDETGQAPYGLDIGSSTGALRNLKIPGVAVSMGEPRGKERQMEDAANGQYVVAGDVLLRQTWTALRSHMQQRGIAHFQLEMGFLEGGLSSITNNPFVHFIILQNMWGLLDPKGGLLAVQTARSGEVLSSIKYIQKAKWIDYLNTIDGIEATAFGNPYLGIQLIRHPQAPDKLPLNFSLSKEELKKHRTYNKYDYLRDTIAGFKS